VPHPSVFRAALCPAVPPAPQAAFALAAGSSRSSAALSYLRPALVLVERLAPSPRFLSGVGVIRISQGLDARTTRQTGVRIGDGNEAFRACDGGGLGAGKWGQRSAESVAWIRGRWCRGQMPGSGSERVRPVSTEVSAMGSRSVRIEADDDAGWQLKTRPSRRLRQSLPSGVKGSSVSPKKNATLRSNQDRR
jgi:hypothetical protein